MGNILRSPVANLRIMGRATQGVRLINLKENDTIASVACVEVNEENEDIDIAGADQKEGPAEEIGKEFED
jgi:DNA gyrase subunit A